MDAANKKIGAYSKGMRQRVKLAQALVHDPQLLILDEPLTGMDPLMRRKTIRFIKDWARAGKHIIVSSHILHEIEAMTSNILLINNGRIVAEGNVHAIRELIDTHPHTVFIRGDDPRALARRFLAEDDVLSLRFEPGAVVVETSKPDSFYARLTQTGDERRGGQRGRGHLAGRQPAGGLPLSGEAMMPAANATPSTSAVAAAPAGGRSLLGRVAAGLRPLARRDALVAPHDLHGAGRRRPGDSRRSSSACSKRSACRRCASTVSGSAAWACSAS